MGVVLKYGGSSVASTEQIQEIAAYICMVKQEESVVVVVSAMGKSTDQLMLLAKQLSKRLPKRELDTLLSTGEQQTIALLSIALHGLGVDAISLTGFQAGFRTTSSHTKGIIKDIEIERVMKHLKENKVVVVAGFQGISDEGDITTLGRGGSDTSAVALAAKLGYRCEIYTDVDGIYTVDPRVYPNAKKIDQLSFEEMMEMSILGAGVIETRSVELAKKYNVNLYIAKSLSEKGSGTFIMNHMNLFEDKPITGISVTDHVLMITLEGKKENVTSVSEIFQVVSNHNINLDMINQSIDKDNRLVLSFSIDEQDEDTFIECTETSQQLFSPFLMESKKDIVKISLVGVGMASHFGVAAKVFTTLTNEQIPYYHVSTSEISISCTVDFEQKSQAIHALAKAFNL